MLWRIGFVCVFVVLSTQAHCVRRAGTRRIAVVVWRVALRHRDLARRRSRRLLVIDVSMDKHRGAHLWNSVDNPRSQAIGVSFFSRIEDIIDAKFRACYIVPTPLR